MGLFSKGGFLDKQFGYLVDAAKSSIDEILQAEKDAGVRKSQEIQSDRENRERISQAQEELYKYRSDLGADERLAIATGGLSMTQVILLGITGIFAWKAFSRKGG